MKKIKKRHGPKPRVSEAQRAEMLAAYKRDPAEALALCKAFGVRPAYATELASQYSVLRPKVGRKGGKPYNHGRGPGDAVDHRWAWAIERGHVVA